MHARQVVFGTATLVLVTLSLSAGRPVRAQQPAAPAPAASAGQTLPVGQLGCVELSAALRGVMTNDVRLRDWAQLARYRDANRAAGPVDVVFMGDSITDSWPQERFGPWFPGRRYAGRGISGQTTPQMLVRFRPDVITLKPKAVVILAGTNDIAGNTGPMTDEEIEGNLASMSELAVASGIKVVLSSITPTSAYHVGPSGLPQTTTRPMARIQAINAWMRDYAAAHGHVYLDYFSAMVDASGVMRSELTGDDLHPNAAGYAIMAPLAQAAIDRALR
ncbi:MAG: SGNH/GDSL hydrolase family protein [Acidobacteria bacterium]|nr:SGNH/GDSL hydrolase family protein [Acidobacteriota bacterium]